MSEIKPSENIINNNNDNEINKEEELSESETENVELEAMGDNKIIFL